MDSNEALLFMLGEKYYTIDDLRYNQKIGIMLSGERFREFLDTKDCMLDEGCDYLKKLPLKTFNSKHLFYVDGKYLLSLRKEYLRILLSDFDVSQGSLFDRNVDQIIVSRLFSEVEGSLAIENVPTTHKRIAEIQRNGNLKDKNDIIVKNMLNAVKYIINEKPQFNKDNLLKLYSILSNDCLDEDCKLKDGAFYRDDSVTIDNYEGADHHILDECMDSMFAFANASENIKKYGVLLPYICHYYILYVHPYFDYNGRTARMVSFWLNWINNIVDAPYFMSEAINESKNSYYKALRETRNTRNDLTYFLGYVLETSIKYSFVYKNLEEIAKHLMKTGDVLTQTELVYVKKILVHNPCDYFNYKMFLKYINSKMSSAGAIKVLNKLTEYGILKKTENRRGGVIYSMSSDVLTYKYNF